jgi:uncharacterized membrane protein/glutaredoxin
MLSLMDYQNTDAVVIKILKMLSINIDSSAIVAELETHPDYPSLLAISDVLNAFNIGNKAFRVQFEELKHVNCPFLAHTNLNGGEFVVVNKMDALYITLSKSKGKHKLGIEEFKKQFSGVILCVEAPEEPTVYKKTFTFDKFFAGPITFAVVLLMFFNIVIFNTNYLSAISWQTFSLTLFKSTGLITSILLLLQSIDRNNSIVQKFCSGNKSDCNSILSSKAAKVVDGLTWSEVGFFYFAGTWLLEIFGNHSVATTQFLGILNIISLPYTFYSVYYQAKIAKQWCVLCCTIQLLLWLEFIPSVTAFKFPFTPPSYAELSSWLVALASPVLFWEIIKPIYFRIKQLQPLKQQLRQFKYNTELFNTVLNAEPSYAMPDENWCIVLGNVEANTSITIVSGPYCPPCAHTHKLLDDLLKQRGDVQARIVYITNNSGKDRNTPVVKHLMALNALPDKTIIKHALHDWYNQKQKDYKAWAKVYPVQINETDSYKLDKQTAWCKMANVVATPALFLNGTRIPDIYKLSDLKYMLE